MTVSDWAGSVSDWREALEGMRAFIAPAFKRSEQRASAGTFIDGLLSGVERKTGWMLAEEAGLARPYRILIEGALNLGAQLGIFDLLTDCLQYAHDGNRKSGQCAAGAGLSNRHHKGH